MALIKVADRQIEAKDIDINPFVDENSNIVFESILVDCNEVPVHLKEKAYYDGEISGENEETGKKEVHAFKGYKLEAIDNNKILLIHPQFTYKYELEIYASPKK